MNPEPSHDVVRSLQDEIDILQQEKQTAMKEISQLVVTRERQHEQLRAQGDEIARLRDHNEHLGQAVDNLISSIASLSEALRTFF